MRISRHSALAGLLIATGLANPAVAQEQERRNVVFVLIDDQRFDATSLLGHPFLETPHLDALTERGLNFENAFVTTSLCSPSRASILTGQYAHRHQVLANRTPLDPSIPTFPQVLQEAGYQTAFVGKWHMGGANDSPRPGFDRWISFPGQGSYYGQRLNIDGEHVEHEGYITDTLTQYAVEFVESASAKDAPFLVYLSHKAVHSPFRPAERHDGSYGEESYVYPDSMADTDETYAGKPDWVRAQRRSWHGVDGLYNNQVDFDEFLVDYAETLRAVDDSVGRMVDVLERTGELANTVLVFTSDNGFQFGEHGLIDKRTMYEASIRVPLLVLAPGLVAPGSVRSEMILNIDFAPTFIELAGASQPETIQGRSFVPLLGEGDAAWRDAFLYEYFWERAFPQTPTVLGVRTETHKLMRYHGVWDRYELYDLVADPEERNNLIGRFKTRHGLGNVELEVLAPEMAVRNRFIEGPNDDEELKELFRSLSTRLDQLLEETGAAREPNWLPITR